tara:strand:- start:96 stop:338 length:243 start_codon:yes stop_codon:yes gene_type:complete
LPEIIIPSADHIWPLSRVKKSNGPFFLRVSGVVAPSELKKSVSPDTLLDGITVNFAFQGINSLMHQNKTIIPLSVLWIEL